MCSVDHVACRPDPRTKMLSHIDNTELLEGLDVTVTGVRECCVAADFEELETLSPIKGSHSFKQGQYHHCPIVLTKHYNSRSRLNACGVSFMYVGGLASDRSWRRPD